MENKYYQPTIEEFHVGFEFESFVDRFKEWKFNKIGKYELNAIAANINCDFKELYRVKYLDKEDIESLGFKKSNKNSWIGYKDYFLDKINPEYPFFLFATIHIPIRDDMYKIYVHRFYNENECINEDDIYREPTCVFNGKIKNKSELKKLLIQLGIN